MSVKEARTTGSREHIDSTDLYTTRKRRRLTAQEVASMIQRGHGLVRGKFENKEAPGQQLRFNTLFWPGDEIEEWTFEDGGIYTIPRDVAMHIVNDMWYPENAYKQDENGRPVAVIGRKVHRFAFTPLDFMSESDLRDLMPSNIETVTSLRKEA